MNGCERFRFGIVNEQPMEEKLKHHLAQLPPQYGTTPPISAKVSALNFAVECAKMGACEKSTDAIVALANKVLNNYFK